MYIIFSPSIILHYHTYMLWKNYEVFKENLKQPGRPLHFLFLEKVFQLSAPVPDIDSETKQRYWEYLLNTKENSDLEETSLKKANEILKREIRKKEEEFKKLTTDQQ